MDAADLVVINTCAIREAAEQKVIGRQGQLAKLKAANPSLRVVMTGCAVRELDRAGLDGVSRRSTCSFGPTRSRSSSTGSGWRPRRRRSGSARRRDDGRRPARSSASRTTSPAPAPPPSRAGRVHASSAIARLAADHLRLRQDLHLLHRPVQPRPGAVPAVRRDRRRGAHARRAGLPRGHAARPERQLVRARPRAGAAIRPRRHRALGGPPARPRQPPGPRGAHPRDRRPPHRRRRARDPAPAVHHLAPVGPLGSADRGHGRLPVGLRAAPPAGAVGRRRRAQADGPPVHDRALPRAARPHPRGRPRHRDLDRRHRRLLRRDRGAVRVDAPPARARPLRPGLRGRVLASGPARPRRASPTTSRRTTSGAG